MATITLPIIVSSTDASPMSVEATVADNANIDRIWIQGNITYQNQGSVRVNGGTWVDFNNTNATCAAPDVDLFCIGGAVPWIRFALPIAVDWNIIAGENTVEFRWTTADPDGDSSNYYVIHFNFLRTGDAIPTAFSETDVIDTGDFVYDDPSAWVAPSGYDNPDSVASGKTLWETAALTQTPGGASITAKCMDCHAEDGRDLQYFAFSNKVITNRSQFHDLTESEGKKIAAYIRSLELQYLDGTPYDPPGRPWNAPYQPCNTGFGPNSNQAADDVNQQYWAAGGGLSCVLDDDIDAFEFMFPGGTVRAQPFHADSTINLRAQPLSVQFADWNTWLPRVHPKDTWTTAQLEDIETEYANLQSNAGARNAGGTETALGRLDTAVKERRRASDARPAGLTDLEWARAQTSLQQWQVVKVWEQLHTNHMENQAPNLYTGGEPLSWISRSRNLFDVAPHIANVNGAEHEPFIFGEQPGSMEIDKYWSHLWYHMQTVINGGNKVGTGQKPVDWGYQRGHQFDFSYRLGVPSGIRWIQTSVKQIQSLGPQDSQWHVAKHMHLAELIKVFFETNKFADTWANMKGHARETDIIESLVRAWTWNQYEYSEPDYPRGTSSAAWDPADTVPTAWDGSGNIFSFNADADNWYRMISPMIDVGVASSLLDSLIDRGEELWPNGDWQALREQVPGEEVGTPPTVTLTAPADGDTLGADGVDYTITATASDNETVARVEFLINGAKIGEDTTDPYSFLWENIEAGTYGVSARAVDNEGNRATTEEVTVYVTGLGPEQFTLGLLNHPWWADGKGNVDGSLDSMWATDGRQSRGTTERGFALYADLSGRSRLDAVIDTVAGPWAFSAVYLTAAADTDSVAVSATIEMNRIGQVRMACRPTSSVAKDLASNESTKSLFPFPARLRLTDNGSGYWRGSVQPNSIGDYVTVDSCQVNLGASAKALIGAWPRTSGEVGAIIPLIEVE